MTHLIYVTWENTEDNHAGMKYLCKKLQELYPDEYLAHEMLRPLTSKPHKYSNNFERYLVKLKLGLRKTYQDHVIKKRNTKFAEDLVLAPTDKIILMEYLDSNINQYAVAKAIKRRFPKIKIYALSHLVPQKIDRMFSDLKLKKWISYVDYIITLGSSLTNYYAARNVPKSKILTTFHYVDDYYINNILTYHGHKVLVQGNQMRDIGTLEKIIQNNPKITFVVCQGLQDLSQTFNKYQNVELMTFLKEAELKELMSVCPISLNVMYDTIGSNVIVTSMGMGEVMVCSDVGSIRDYCDESNCIFCQDVTDFSNALRVLSEDPNLLEKMRQSSIQKVYKFRIQNFHKFLLELN